MLLLCCPTFAIYFLHRLDEHLPTVSLRCRLCSSGLAAFNLETGSVGRYAGGCCHCFSCDWITWQFHSPVTEQECMVLIQCVSFSDQFNAAPGLQYGHLSLCMFLKQLELPVAQERPEQPFPLWLDQWLPYINLHIKQIWQLFRERQTHLRCENKLA